MKMIFKQIISILLLSIILGLFRNYFIPNNHISLFKNEKKANKMIEGMFVIPDFMTEPQIVNTDFTKYYFDNNNIIIDSRDEEQYNEEHIKGSINIPYNYYEDYDILYDLAPEDVYIVYCNGGDCGLSLDLAYIMYDEFDFETVFVYEDGIPVWKDNSYPLSSNINDKEKVEDFENNNILKTVGIICFLITYLIFIIRTVKDSIKSRWEVFTTILVVSFRLILGYVFIYASIQKILNPLEFSNQIDLYKATPLLFNNLIALVIPWVEFIIGLCLILNRNIKGSIILSILLFIVFITLLSQAYYRGISLDCGCFGTGIEKTTVELFSDMLNRIKEDIIFLCMSLYLYFIYIYNRRKYA